jgi:hypothetical protein
MHFLRIVRLTSLYWLVANCSKARNMSLCVAVTTEVLASLMRIFCCNTTLSITILRSCRFAPTASLLSSNCLVNE